LPIISANLLFLIGSNLKNLSSPTKTTTIAQTLPGQNPMQGPSYPGGLEAQWMQGEHSSLLP
jgi:hypothetical protein